MAGALAVGTGSVALMQRGNAPALGVALPMASSVVHSASSVTALLAAQPLWHPAGDVLRRKAADAPIAPFSVQARHTTSALEALDRWHRIFQFSARYHTKPEMARRIYDAALVANIEPDLGFRLVRAESEFSPRAVSPVGAIGLTQLMLGTARDFEPQVTREQLMDPDINLRIGFTYLRALIREYNGNLRTALLVYNRGPVAVKTALSNGDDPANGYETVIMRGYRGNGVLE